MHKPSLPLSFPLLLSLAEPVFILLVIMEKCPLFFCLLNIPHLHFSSLSPSLSHGDHNTEMKPSTFYCLIGKFYSSPLRVLFLFLLCSSIFFKNFAVLLLIKLLYNLLHSVNLVLALYETELCIGLHGKHYFSRRWRSTLCERLWSLESSPPMKPIINLL